MGMTIEEYESSDLMAENEFLRKQLAEALKHRRMFEADYENRLKADMVAMLTEIQLEIEDLYPEHQCTGELTGFADAIETITPIIQQKINELPSVTPIRPKGYWKTRPLITFCSECGFELKIDNTNYCPNCGAKMVEPQESEERTDD